MILHRTISCAVLAGPNAYGLFGPTGGELSVRHWGWIAGLGAIALCAAVPLALRAAPQASAPVIAAIPETNFAICKDGTADAGRPDPAWVLASYDGDNCRAPPLPPRLDGRNAPREKIVAAMAVAKRYDASAHAFERCIADVVAARKGRVTDKSFLLVENHRQLVSEKNRRLAAAQLAAAIDAFNAFGSECAE